MYLLLGDWVSCLRPPFAMCVCPHHGLWLMQVLLEDGTEVKLQVGVPDTLALARPSNIHHALTAWGIMASTPTHATAHPNR